MGKKELKKEIRERLKQCDFGKIVDFYIYDSRVVKGKFVFCNVITIKNHLVTKIYYTYNVENKHIEVADVKTFY